LAVVVMEYIPGVIWLIVNPLAGLIIYAVKRTPRLGASFLYGIGRYFVCGVLAAFLGYISKFPPYSGPYNVDFAMIARLFCSDLRFLEHLRYHLQRHRRNREKERLNRADNPLFSVW